MVALCFVLLIALIFAGLIVFENQKSEMDLSLKSTGLWRWLTAADWPSKIGAVLVIIGVGALLRYMMLFVHVPPVVKIASGGLISLGLAAASFALRKNDKRRTVHTALAGAALGTAYLTIFSAHNFFYLIPQVWAFNALAVLCALGALYAVRSTSASVAVLAMFGAFMVPVLAVNYTAPVTLIAYYLGLSTISWGIVRQTEWRSILHLNMIFTLLGGLAVMSGFHLVLPSAMQSLDFSKITLVIALFLMLHLAMTLALGSDKKDFSDKTWKRYFTVADMWVIAALVALLAFSYTLNRSQDAVLFAVLSCVWLAAAAIGHYLQRKELPHYIAIASLYAITTGALYFDDLPILLLLQALGVILLWQAPRLNISNDTQDRISVAVMVTALGYMATASHDWNYDVAFTGQKLAYHLTAAGLLLYSAWIAKERGLGLSSLLGWTGGLWAACVIIHELIVMDLPPAVISMVGAVIGALLVLAGESRQKRILWTIGMAFMAGSAVKMVFFDFGSLGQLANILAMIGTGLLFIGINWLAPYPPAAPPTPEKIQPENSEPKADAAKKPEAVLAAAFADPIPSQPIAPTNPTTVGIWAIAASCLGAGLCLYWKMDLSGTQAWLALLWLLPLVIVAFFVSFGCIIASFIKDCAGQAALAILIWTAAFFLIFSILDNPTKPRPTPQTTQTDSESRNGFGT